MSALGKQLKTQLVRYLDEKCSLDEFSDVLASAHESSDAESQALAIEIEWEFCDLERGQLTPEVLRTNLKRLAEREQSPVQTVVWLSGIIGTQHDSTVVTGTSSTVGIGPLIEFASG